MSCWGSYSYGQVMPFGEAVLRSYFVFLQGGEKARGCNERQTFDSLCVLFLQLGDGSTTFKSTPVAVSGLSGGIAMVALGDVRLFETCCCCWCEKWRCELD